MIRSGNKDYSVEIKDPSILDVKIDLSSPIGMGNLDIYPKQKWRNNYSSKGQYCTWNNWSKNKDSR